MLDETGLKVYLTVTEDIPAKISALLDSFTNMGVGLEGAKYVGEAMYPHIERRVRGLVEKFYTMINDVNRKNATGG